MLQQQFLSVPHNGWCALFVARDFSLAGTTHLPGILCFLVKASVDHQCTYKSTARLNTAPEVCLRYHYERVDLVFRFLACRGRWPSQLSGSSAKASTSSNSFSSARWVTCGVSMFIGGYSRGFEVPRKQQHYALYTYTCVYVCIRACGTFKPVFLRAMPKHLMCISALTVTVCDTPIIYLIGCL